MPVYKVEPYLKKCIDSILAQTSTDFELILVDDGSPDGCPAICDEYAEKDSRVKVIHKENGGLSDARNVGINVATGEYILFLDSDDCLETERRYIKTVVDFILSTRLDVYFFTSIQEVPSRSHWTANHICTVHSRKRFLLRTFFSVPYQAAWLFIVRRTFIVDNNLFFRMGVLHEDEEWMPRVLLKNKRAVGIISFPLYIYRTERPDSIVNTRGEKSVSDKADFIIQFAALYKTLTAPCEKKFLATRIANLYTGIMREKKIPVEACLKKINKFSYFMKSSLFIKHRLLYILCKLNGQNDEN